VLPENIYSVEQVRELDRLAIEEHGIAGYELMQRAGLATFQQLLSNYPDTRAVKVYCGLGNNGGDGYVIARLVGEAGMWVELVTLGDHTRVSGDALKAKQDWLAFAPSMPSTTSTSSTHPIKPDIIIDAIFGTGLARPATGDWLQAIQEINHSRIQSGIKIVAVDVPSGLDADNGMPLGEAVIADLTVTYIGMKLGLLTATAGDYTGHIKFDALEIPDSVNEQITPVARRLTQQLLIEKLPPRKPSTHKGDCGHALIIGGAVGMQGAAQMAAEACARSGAGLTTLATEQAANLARAEIMTCITSPVDNLLLQRAIDKATVIAIGPGLSQNTIATALMGKVVKLTNDHRKPVVVDADGLNLLAQSPKYYDHWVLTPHPGEAARLLNITTAEVQQSRVDTVKAIQKKYGGVCILKGFGSLIYDGGQLSICSAGNPGMASGGMGDVLTGIITGLIAQKLSLYDAARIGVYIHAKAADLVVKKEGERGLLATDLFPNIRRLVNLKLD
jgi:NAD(P)H-hydrate epimerase